MGFSSKPSIKRTQPSKVFGHIPGVPVGSTFENRLFLHHASVHSGILAGISGTKHEGCYSVVLSGGYEDDKDEGYRFTYTGCGGRDKKDGEKPREGPQTCDQKWENTRNASLRLSAHTKKPVRVVRGYSSSSDFAPVRGYRYDGLYVVDQAWMDAGKSGFKVCKFILTRLPDQPPIPRREGTLNLDLSHWEQPRHFWNDTPSSPTVSSSTRSKNDKAKEKAHGNAEAGPSQARSKPHMPLPPPAPILPTTNVVAARARQQRPSLAQTSTSAPAVDVTALFAEMHGVAPKPPPVSMPTLAAAGPSRPPAPAPSSRTTDPQKRLPNSTHASAPAPAPAPAKAGRVPPLSRSSPNRTTDPRDHPSSASHAASPASGKPQSQRSAPLAPVHNASAIRRKRSFGAHDVEDGPEDLKKPKIAGSKGGQRSPQKACPGARGIRPPVKQEARDGLPKRERSFIDLTGSDDED